MIQLFGAIYVNFFDIDQLAFFGFKRNITYDVILQLAFYVSVFIVMGYPIVILRVGRGSILFFRVTSNGVSVFEGWGHGASGGRANGRGASENR